LPPQVAEKTAPAAPQGGDAAAPSRRRFLTILAATSAAGLMRARGGKAAEADLQHWQGSALGADASIALAGVNGAQANRLFALCLAEVERQEALFSLQETRSALCRLNAHGSLAAPDADLLYLLDLSRDIFAASARAFDPTIQPLWLLYAETYGARPAARTPGANEIAARSALVGLDNVQWSKQRIAFARPGMGLTLNGIAQGHITDRVAQLLRAHGLEHALVNLGEYRALGTHPEGRPWQIAVQDPRAATRFATVLDVTDQAVATSGAYGGRFGESGMSHLIDARTAKSPDRYLSVSVVHKSAAVADGLSTAFSFMAEDAIRAAAKRFGTAKILLVQKNGALTTI
jgi:thiamine biosynthesis lipoprotein